MQIGIQRCGKWQIWPELTLGLASSTRGGENLVGGAPPFTSCGIAQSLGGACGPCSGRRKLLFMRNTQW